MEAHTYCRLCSGTCGVVLTIEHGRPVSVRPDRDHAASHGFVCIKGLQLPEIHNAPERIRHTHKRMPDQQVIRIASEQALDEIAEQTARIIETHGPRAIATYLGTQAAFNVLLYHFVPPFMQAIGSPNLFGTMTIDQSAKWVAEGRLGVFGAGRPAFDTLDVLLACGTNPLSSMGGGQAGMPNYDPHKLLRQQRDRGMKLIVVDPLETQLAKMADIFLQIIPGEDATLFAALIREVLAQGWYDADFCDRYVLGLDRLKEIVEPFDLPYAARRTGLSEASIRRTAEMYARDSARGTVGSGTGANMSAHSNVCEHLVRCLDVVCGYFARPGDVLANPGVLNPQRSAYAEVVAPHRSWEKGLRSRVGDHGMMYGQMMTGVLADEILLEGDGQIRALFCAAGNPGGALPDQRKAVRALGSLELLVTAEPRWSETARLAHYVFAPNLLLERPDHTKMLENFYHEPFGQYTPRLIDPAPASDQIDDWYLFWAIAKKLGLSINLLGVDIPMDEAPTSDDLLAILARHARIPYEQVKRYPQGHVFDDDPVYVQPPRPEATGRFDVAPDDVAAELAAVLEEPARAAAAGYGPVFTHLLTARRIRETMNTMGREFPGVRRRMTTNPAHMNPADLESLGFEDGDRIEIESENDCIPAIVKADAAVRPGVVSMVHGWGGLPEDEAAFETVGSSTSRLISSDRYIEKINGMPRMSAIPVRLRAMQDSAPPREPHIR